MNDNLSQYSSCDQQYGGNEFKVMPLSGQGNKNYIDNNNNLQQYNTNNTRYL